MGDAQADAGHAQRGVPGTAEVAAFWAWAEGSLFSSSLERKYLGFMLFGLLLPSLRWGVLADVEAHGRAGGSC